jgi:predicted Fe-S protein YdhL (DUF1289 family)
MDGFPASFDALFGRLETSPFRRRFRLGAADRAYVLAKGFDTIRRHAEAFICERLAPAEPRNDGKQTPMRGHPVFVAQHATACCCRGCLRKWHGIPGGMDLSPAEQRHVVDVIMAWIGRQMAAIPAPERPPSPAPVPANRRRTRKSPGAETPGLPFLS